MNRIWLDDNRHHVSTLDVLLARPVGRPADTPNQVWSAEARAALLGVVLGLTLIIAIAAFVTLAA